MDKSIWYDGLPIVEDLEEYRGHKVPEVMSKTEKLLSIKTHKNNHPIYAMNLSN